MKGRLQDIKLFVVGVLVILVVNYLASLKFWRLDFTEDQRYSISESTIKLVKTVPDSIHVVVYLHGNISSEYQRLEKTVSETLDELRAYAGDHFTYEFQDPLDVDTDSMRTANLRQLSGYGLKVRIQTNEETGAQKIKYVVPGAVVHLGNRIVPINFIKDGANGMDENFNQSLSEVEYELAAAIKVITSERKKRIAFIDGHDEANASQLQSVIEELSAFYRVGFLNLKDVEEIKDVEAVVIVQPKKAYSDEDKFKLDQFVLKGGTAMYFINPYKLVPSDSSNALVGLPYEIGLDNLLRQYGARIEMNAIQDQQCALGPMKRDGKITLAPNNFMPIFDTYTKHIITKNLNPILSRDVSSIDTVSAAGVRKIPLVFSSKYTRQLRGMIQYSFAERLFMDSAYFPERHLPVAYLMEGRFKSMFITRPVPPSLRHLNKVTEGDQGKVFVFGDANVIMNDYNVQAKRGMPIGMNKYDGTRYANLNFIKNTINYMLGEEGIVNLRAKEYIIRDLDVNLIDEKNEQLSWQIINVIIPVLIVVLFGIGRYYWRKNKYGKQSR